jgi:hypothetical protein
MRMDINLNDLPAFDVNRFVHNLSPDERKVEIAVFMKLMIDDRKGIYHEPNYRTRRDPNRADGSQIFKAIEIKDLLPLLLQETSAPEDREEHPHSEIRPNEVVGRENGEG